MSDKRKQQWLANAPLTTLEHIVGTLGANEIKEPSPEFPLGGLVFIDGVGQIKVTAIRSELARRFEEAS